jgi:hypothetical protein
MPNTNTLDLLGKLVMNHLRDRSFEFFELLAKGHWKAPALVKLQNDLRSFSAPQLDIVRRAVRSSVDTGIHDFLFALYNACEDGAIELRLGGKNVTELSDGLQGELFTEDGWEARLSRFGQAPEQD